MKSICLLLLSNFCWLMMVGQDLLLQNLNYVDVNSGNLIENQDLLIRDGLIHQIANTGRISTDEAIRKDLAGKVVMPGLIDAHVHLFQSGGLYTRPDAVSLQGIRPYQEEIDWINQHIESTLQRYLKAGITSIVDVGGPMQNYVHRDTYKDHPNTPNIFITGPLVSTYQPPAFKIEDPPIIQVENQDEAIALVRKQKEYDPDFIKIWYINLPYFPADSAFPMVKAVVEESHKLGLPVAIHATELNTAKLAIRAGGDYLVHSVSESIDDEFIQLCLDNDIVLSPSLLVSSNYDLVFSGRFDPLPTDFAQADPFVLGTLFDPHHLQEHPAFIQYEKIGQRFAQRNRIRDSVQVENLIKLVDAGVTIATGTDAGNIGTLHTSSYLKELNRMQSAGMTNAQILKASTINAAKAAGRDHEVGLIKEGMIADLLILDQNPLRDIAALQQLHHVVKKGTWINPKDLLTPTPEDLAQQQLNAYNARDINAFLEPYAADVKIFSFPNKLTMEGKEMMRERYGNMFNNLPDLHCRLVNRMVLGNTVIDQEEVRLKKGDPLLEAVAIYKIKDGKIAEVYFVRKV